MPLMANCRPNFGEMTTTHDIVTINKLLLLKCITKFNDLILNLFASLVSKIESNQLAMINSSVAMAVAIVTASNNVYCNVNCNCSYATTKNFKHFLSHRKMCSHFKLTYTNNNDTNDYINYLLVDRHDIVPFVGTKSNAFVATVFIFIFFIVIIIIIIMVVVLVSLFVLQLISIVHLVSDMWRMCCAFRLRIQLALAKAKMLRALQKCCMTNRFSAKLNAHKKRDKSIDDDDEMALLSNCVQDLGSFRSYLFVPKSMERSIVVQMVQMLVKNDKNTASTTNLTNCTMQTNPVLLDGSADDRGGGGGGGAGGDGGVSVSGGDNAETYTNLTSANETNGAAALTVNNDPTYVGDANISSPSTSSATTRIHKHTAACLRNMENSSSNLFPNSKIVYVSGNTIKSKTVDCAHKGVIAATACARPPLNKFHKSLVQTTNFVRVVKAPPQPRLQPIVHNVIRTVATKSTTNATSSIFGNGPDISTINKQFGQNLFIYNAEGKIIRLTPLLGNNNCFASNVVDAMPLATTISSDGGETNAAKKLLSLNSSKVDERKNYVALKLDHSNDDATGRNVLLNKSPAVQFNAFVVANAASIGAKQSQSSGSTLVTMTTAPLITVTTTTTSAAAAAAATTVNTRSIYEETYAKFLKTKESTSVCSDSVESLPLKKPQTQAATIVQCHPLLKTGTAIPNSKPTTNIFVGGNSGARVAKQPLVGLPSIILKHLPKTVRPMQNFTFAKENGGAAATAKVQMNDSNNATDAVAAGHESPSAAPATNQLRITFPLISSAAGAEHNLCTAFRDANAVSRHVQSIERSKLIARKSSTDGRNVDHFTLEQLREFDMVLEQVKERSTTTTATTISTATCVAPTVAPELLTSSLANGFGGHQRRVSLISSNGQSISTAAGLLQKINLAILKKNSSDANILKGSTKQSNSQPIVVVATTNCSPSSVNNVIFSPAAVTNIIQHAPPTQSEQIEFGDMTISDANHSDDNQIRTKSINDLPSSKSQLQQMQQKSNVATTTTTATTTTSAIATKPSNKSQEDEQTVQRIYDILAQYAQQISSSPDLNNKPAPRRRSNLVSAVPQSSQSSASSTNATSSRSSTQTSAKTSSSSTITAACLSSGNSSESSSQGIPSTQPLGRKRFKSTSVAVCADTIESVDNSENAENDAGPEKRHRLNASVTNSTVENRDFIITTTSYSRSDQGHLRLSNAINATNALRNGTTGNSFLLSSGTTMPVANFEPLTIGIPSAIDGASATETTIGTTQMPNQAAAILISGNYLLPMGMIKSNRIDANETVICTTTNKGNVSQVLRPNLATLMFSRNTANFHTDASNVSKAPIVNNQKFQFQTIKMTKPNCGHMGSSITTMAGGDAGATAFPSTILLPTIATHVTETKPSAIRSANEFQGNGNAAAAKFSPHIFQSNRGIIILNKKTATSISSNPVAAVPVITTSTSSSSCNSITADTFADSNTTTAADGFFISLNQTTNASNEYLTYTKTTMTSTPMTEAATATTSGSNTSLCKDQIDDDASQSMTMPLSFTDESDPIFDQILRGGKRDATRSLIADETNDIGAEEVVEPTHQYHDQLYHNENDHEQVVIIDKKKSDALTLNSASNRRHDFHIKTRNDIERQLRLQKSLSEECEDLGVDEPSTSELFPEAELSFDNNSPTAFDALGSHAHGAVSRNAFEFPSRLPSSKVHKRNITHKMHKQASNAYDTFECGSSRNNQFNEMSSNVGLNHTAYKDFNDSDGMLDEYDDMTNAYSIKNTIIMDNIDKSTSNATRIFREIRGTSKIITSKSNRMRKYGIDDGIHENVKICDTATPFSLENGNGASMNSPNTNTLSILSGGDELTALNASSDESGSIASHLPPDIDADHLDEMNDSDSVMASPTVLVMKKCSVNLRKHQQVTNRRYKNNKHSMIDASSDEDDIARQSKAIKTRKIDGIASTAQSKSTKRTAPSIASTSLESVFTFSSS